MIPSLHICQLFAVFAASATYPVYDYHFAPDIALGLTCADRFPCPLIGSCREKVNKWWNISRGCGRVSNGCLKGRMKTLLKSGSSLLISRLQRRSTPRKVHCWLNLQVHSFINSLLDWIFVAPPSGAAAEWITRIKRNIRRASKTEFFSTRCATEVGSWEIGGWLLPLSYLRVIIQKRSVLVVIL